MSYMTPPPLLPSPSPPLPLSSPPPVCRRHNGMQQEMWLPVLLTEEHRALLSSNNYFVHLRFCPRPATKTELLGDEYPKQLYVKVNSSAIAIPVSGHGIAWHSHLAASYAFTVWQNVCTPLPS